MEKELVKILSCLRNISNDFANCIQKLKKFISLDQVILLLEIYCGNT